MTSILTNLAAMSALSTLTGTQRSLAATQSQISTGLRISTAADNPSYWGIATLMRSRIGDVQTINDSLNITDSLLNVTSAALNNILTAMNAIKIDVMEAQSSGVSWDTLQLDVAQQQKQIETYAKGANFNGQNLLDRSWDETATEDVTLNYDGNTLLGGSGTENYSYTDGQGTRYELQDDFTVSPNGEQTYSKLGHLSANPYTQFAIPEGETGTGLQMAYLDMHDINVLGQYNLNPTVFTSPPSYNEILNKTINYDNQAQGPSSSVASYLQYAYAGRGYSTPYSDTPMSAYSDLAQTHSYAGTGVTDTSGNNILPFEKNTSGAGSIYYPTPMGNNLYQVTPYAGILDFSLTNNQEYNYSNGPNGTASSSTDPYDLTQSDLAAYQDMIERNISRTTTGIAALGSEMTALSNQRSYNASLVDTLTAGVGSLVDADMNEASTRLAALQTQQQLGIWSLSIANDNTTLVLKLFGS